MAETTYNDMLIAARKVAERNERRLSLAFGNLSPDLDERVAQAAELKIATDLWQRAEAEYQTALAHYHPNESNE